MKLKYYIPFCIALCLSLNTYAQSCEQQIETAKTYYDQGQFSQVITTLSTCKENEDPTIRFSVHRILALSYLEMDEKQLALQSAKEMLRVDPTYKPSSISDPAEFHELIKSVLVIPKLSFGVSVSAGTIQGFPEVSEVYSIAESNSRVYRTEGGFMLGTAMSYQLNNAFSVNLELQVQQRDYGLDYDVSTVDLTMDERNTFLVAPLSGRYHFDINKRFQPYVQLGGYASRLLQSRASFTYDNTVNEESFNLENVNALDRRNKWDFGAVGGVGLLYKAGLGYFNLEMNYYRSFTDLVDDDQRYSNPTLHQQYYHLDDQLKLHALSVSLGFHMILNYKVVD